MLGLVELVAPDDVPVPEVLPLVDPVVPLVAVPLVVSAVEPVLDPEVPIDEELLAPSSVPVTWTRLPTFFESLSLSVDTSRYVVPAMPEALPIELLLDALLGDVLLLDVLLGDVLLVSDEVLLPVALVSVLLPVVPDAVPDIPEALDEPIMAFVSVHAPVVPWRHPVRVMLFEALDALL